MDKPKVGDKLFMTYHGEPFDTEVTRAGRKYFWVKGRHGRDIKFYIESFEEVTEWSTSQYRLYRTRKEYDEEQELCDVYDRIRMAFSNYSGPSKYSLDDLRAIDEILSKYEGTMENG